MFRSLLVTLLRLWMLACLSGGAWATAVDVSTPRNAIPPNIATSSNRPMMMLAASKDHTLFGPVYTDFEDIDDDGVIDITFKPTFKYYGYFDPTKCYDYDGSNSLFFPASTATVTGGRYTCSSSNSYWSGNFLNWATMTRLDIVRKMLYGGKRSTDTRSDTILERAHLNYDAHSFVKYYNGTDIRDYTPYTVANLTKTTGSNANVYAGLSICSMGDSENDTNQPIMRVAKGNYRLWATVETTVCQWDDTRSIFSSKLARYYADADKGNGVIKHEVTGPKKTGDGASYSSLGPDFVVRVRACSASLLGDERCQAFTSTVNGTTATYYKPYGLFQEFGFSTTGGAARAEFGVITGSYDSNLVAGALRKNMGDFADEINVNTGVFCHSASSGCSSTTSDGRSTGKGAIKSFDAITLYGRNGGNYGYAGTFPKDLANGQLQSWGNPIGEMVVQALQYYQAVSSTNPSTTTVDTSVGMAVQTWSDPLSNSNSTRKALYGNSVCRPMFTLAFSSSALSFDSAAATPFTTLTTRSGTLDDYVDIVGTQEGINGSSRSVGSVGGATTWGDSCTAKTVNKLSQVSGTCPEAPAMGGTYQLAGAALYGNTTKSRVLTTANTPSDLKYQQDALKVKTLAASLSGGQARIDIAIPGTNPKKYVYINPESLFNNNMPGGILTFASISSSATFGSFIVTWNDTLLGGDYDMDITGFLRYDLIANSASPTGWDIKITTDIPNVCAGGTGTHGFSVIGVANNGVTADGRYLTHQHNSDNINGNLSVAGGYLCGDATYRNRLNAYGTKFEKTVCNVTTGNYCVVKDFDYPVSFTFNMVGAGNALIKEPLWYAAKYGDFTSSVKNTDGTYTDVSLPPDTASWDKLKSDGSSGSDGIPDGYFLARRPDVLELQLRRALDALARDSNAAPAISSAQLVSDGYKYVAKFDSTTVTGSLEAYKVDANGYFASTPNWEVGKLMTLAASGNGTTTGDNGDSRAIITNDGATGVAFRWASLPSTYKTQMTTASTNRLSTTNAELTLNYLRGDQSLEDLNGLRIRGSSILGPIVNGTPWIQSRPVANYMGGNMTTYATFYNNNKSRASLLWVAANDGMLHAFNTSTGAEVMAYVPGALANRLAEIPMQRGTTGRTKLNGSNFTLDSTENPPNVTGTVWPYVDGNPFSGDVQLADQSWATYTFSTLGRGGRAVFALNTTTIANLTEAKAASVFKWQFTSDDDSDLGYITGDVTIHTTSNQASPIARLNNGKFALILGNGNKSSNGKAALFILFVDGPSSGNWSGRYVKIVADTGPNNGLSTARWEDLDGDGTADVVYAGDLKGNMWKFNIGSSDTANWDVAFKSGTTNKPLFTANYSVTTNGVTTTTPLPITSAPQLLFRSSGGLMVNFGTGNAFETGDFPNASVYNAVYGIWDRPGLGSVSGRALPTTSTLVSRTYSRQSDGTVVLTSGGTVDWSTKDGWYFSLPAVSEAVLTDPYLNAGVLTLVAVRPKTSTDDCSNTPNASLFMIDPISGRAERKVQGTATIGSTTYIVAATDISDQKVRVVNDRTTRPFSTTCKAGEPGCTCVGTTCTKTSATCGAGQGAFRVTGQSADATVCYSLSPRLQWREVPGLRTDQ